MMAAIMSFITALKAAFLSRTRREQWLIGIMAVMIAGLVAVYGVVMPLNAALMAAEKRQRLAFDNLQAAQRLSGQIRALDSVTPPEDLRGVIEQAAGEVGIVLSNFQDGPEGGYRFIAEAAGSPILFVWLARLDEVHAIRVAQVEVTRTEPGALRASITVKGPVT